MNCSSVVEMVQLDQYDSAAPGEPGAHVEVNCPFNYITDDFTCSIITDYLLLSRFQIRSRVDVLKLDVLHMFFWF